MRFPLYFSRKIATSKENKNNLSKVIVFIGRLSVVLGIIVSLITVATGLGSKKAIRQSLGNFSGELTIKSTRSNSSYNSSVLSQEGLHLSAIQKMPEVAGVQRYINTNGILRTDSSFAGIIFKGVGEDFQADRFKNFLIQGQIPKYKDREPNMDIIISQKIATDLSKKLNDSVVAVFSTEAQKPIYRKFRVAGIYKTDIKLIDDLYIIGAMQHARKVQGFEADQVGGLEIFLSDFNDISTTQAKIQNHIGYKNFIENIIEQFPQISSWISIFDTNVALIITIMLLVVVINIIMVLLILIIERTNSIGMLKTLGATNGQIRAIFINYTLFIMVPGIVLGNVIGLSLLLIQRFFGIVKLNPDNYNISEVPVELNPLYIIAISVGMLIVSAFVLIIPSYLISRISPVKAIKYQ